MPVTQRFVHSGLVLTVALFVVSVCLLILGASRSTVTDDGLPGSVAANFHLKDIDGKIVGLHEGHSQVQVLIVSRINSPLLAKSADRLHQLCETFAKDPSVRILGIQFDPTAGMLDAATAPHGALDPHLTDIHTLFDIDGAVARAYRVNDVPTLFVIDDTGKIRARDSIDGNGISIATTESIASLRRPQNVVFTAPTDRVLAE